MHPFLILNISAPSQIPVTQQTLGKHSLNELTTNGYRIKMLSRDLRAKASHNVEDKKRDERELKASGENPEDPGPEEQLSLPPGCAGKGQHMSGVSCSPLVQQVSRAGQPSHGSELPATAGRDSLTCIAEEVFF
ncbi:hypothetical protein H920_19066 [Fukomys damarensis]|uniref:Uncharacterized protein n=1 Tax=Fukomys damarensis TaxID=885580 RepID=A0A091CPK5_FUKDA|nr:hypothetical protein H920_19066 [Fukomys damarensis]